MSKTAILTTIGVVSSIVGLFTFATGWADIKTAYEGVLERVGLAPEGNPQEARFDTNPDRPELLAMKSTERRMLFHTVAGHYRAETETADRMVEQRGEAPKFNNVQVTALDSGDDPNYLHVQVVFTFYWVGHMSAMPLRGSGIGTVIGDGKVEFSFVDAEGRRGKGLLTGDSSRGRYSIRMDTTELSTGHSLSDQFRQIYNKPHKLFK